MVCRVSPGKRLQTEERVISNVVMMGMGEPLQNYSALVPALKVMLDDHGWRLVASPCDGIHVGRGPHDGPPRKTALWRWLFHCMRPTTPAVNLVPPQSQVSDQRVAGCLHLFHLKNGF